MYFRLLWVFIAVHGLSLVVVSRLLTAMTSLVAEHGLQGTWTSAAAAHELRSCGIWALEHRFSSHGKWA